MQTLDVIFRAERSGPFKGEVTALFPSVAYARPSFDVACYAHIGQHGGADLAWVRERTRPAKPEEFAPLLAELRGIYETGPDAVQLRVVQRMTPAHARARRAG